MDGVIKVLMERYQLTREQAELFAQHVRNSNLPPDNAIKVEALQDTVQPYIDRAKRIAYYNEVNDRYQRGDGVTPDEFHYLQQVKAAEAKRIRDQAAAMVAAKKLVGTAAPVASAVVDRAAPKVSVEAKMAAELHRRGMDANIEQIKLDDGRTIYSVRGVPKRQPPDVQRKIATISSYRPGMEIMPDQAGLIVPVRKK